MGVCWWSLEKFKMPVKIFAVEWKESATNPLAFNSFNSPSEKHSRYFQYKFTLNSNIIYFREFVVYPGPRPGIGPATLQCALQRMAENTTKKIIIDTIGCHADTHRERSTAGKMRRSVEEISLFHSLNATADWEGTKFVYFN